MQVDRYGVDADKAVENISRQLLEHEIITEGYGGEVPIVPVRIASRTSVLIDLHCCSLSSLSFFILIKYQN